MKCLRNAKDDGGQLQVNIQDHSLLDTQCVSLVALQPSQRESQGANGGGRGLEGRIYAYFLLISCRALPLHDSYLPSGAANRQK